MPILIALLLAGLALAIFGKKGLRITGIAVFCAAIGLFVLFLGMSPSEVAPLVDS